jgi:hypothetical protein
MHFRQGEEAMTASTNDFLFKEQNALADLGGAATRFRHNVAALQLLHSLRIAPPRTLTAGDCHTLAHYSGWGDSEVMQRIYPPNGYSWTPICKELEGALTQEDRDSLAASALTTRITRRCHCRLGSALVSLFPLRQHIAKQCALFNRIIQRPMLMRQFV